MSYRNKNSQLLTAGIIAIATAGLLIYFSSMNDTAKAKTTKKDDAEDTKALAPEPKKTAATTSKKEEKKAATTSDATPKKSNVTDQKELHSKIEELDKKGKALFKSKKVCVNFCASFFVCVPSLCCSKVYSLSSNFVWLLLVLHKFDK